jgi:hypothetical protein
MSWNYIDQVEKVHTSKTLTQAFFTFACSMTNEQLAQLYRDGSTMARKLSKGKIDNQTQQWIREQLLQAEMAADVLTRRSVPACTWWNLGRAVEVK